MRYEQTKFGLVTCDADGAVSIAATAAELFDWSHRPMAAWPCSILATYDNGIRVDFDSNGDLVDITGESEYAEDLASDELNAWSTDVLEISGLFDNPAVRNHAR